jgi:hypothetical protein
MLWKIPEKLTLFHMIRKAYTIMRFMSIIFVARVGNGKRDRLCGVASYVALPLEA